MEYCTVDDIKAAFKAIEFKPYSSAPAVKNSSTTQEMLEDWIREESAYINGIIAKVYIVPIVNLENYEDAALILKRICIFRVSARVKNKNELKEEINQKNSDEKYLENKVMTPNDDLTKIGKKEILLIGVPEIDKTGGFSSFATGGKACCGPLFDTCKQQW